LPARPRAILLNKVALRDGPEVVTLERIGPARVPYRMRDAAAFRREIDGLGYRQVAAWDIPELAHVIPTHPGLGPSRSCGFALLDGANPETVSGEARD
jgi:putative methyltransferase (TIGR04325 family)